MNYTRLTALPLAVFLLFCMPTTLLMASGLDFPPVSTHQNHVEEQFASFSHQWIDKLDRNYTARIEKMEFVPHANGVTGRYMQVDRNSVSWSVKQTSKSPLTYIGLLEYLEWTYECVALTRDAAEQGPFVPVSGRKVTEIFQYNANRWLE